MWGAHEADGRIAAKNAVKIRAALRQSVDAKQVFEQYQTTQPAVSDNMAQDRARARAWALLNIRMNNEAVRAAILRLYAEAWVTGEAAANEAIAEEKELRKAADAAIDWSKWNPGDAATALLLDPPRAFQNIVDSTGGLIRGLDRTGYELIGTALSDSIRAGYSPKRAAKLIQDAVGSPARALTIAVTESSRVMNNAALGRYKDAGLEKVQWSTVLGGGTSVACDKCASNDGQIVPIGSSFNTGNTQPPAHPHCRCNLRPVVPDYADVNSTAGSVDMAPVGNKYGDVQELELLRVQELTGKQNIYEVDKRGDARLHSAYKVKGYDAKPVVLQGESFEAAAKDAQARVYRGVNDSFEKAPVLAEQFRTGDYFAGTGVYGNGTYTTTRLETAKLYAGSKGEILEILIPDVSNYVVKEQLSKQVKEVLSEISEKLQVLRKEQFTAVMAKNEALVDEIGKSIDVLTDASRFMHDDGIAATLLGYDGIIVQEKNEIYYVILNRGKVIVKGAP
jgi:SPP1 gp7 family putative phage head morphogenesis protein